ncbi:MAG: hypothetical protein FJW35_03095 [Acidobacteria bacterium]|nr:hypothetical protein [Acidobacteriota bacterium]
MRAGKYSPPKAPGPPPSSKFPAYWPSVAVLLLFVAVISFNQIRSLDLWWHLRTGEWILQNHSIPKADPFSYTAQGRPWVSHEWLFGLATGLVHRALGITGLAAGKCLLLVALFGLTAWLARLRGASPAMTVLVLAAAYEISRLRFTERPELVSAPLAVGFLLAHETGRERPWTLLLLPVLQCLWVNAHGGTSLLGWALAGAVLMDRVLERRRGGESWARSLFREDLRWHWTAAAGVILVSFLNPHGGKTLAYGLIRGESPLDNKEFQSFLDLAREGWSFALVLFVLFAGLTAAFLLARTREGKAYEWLLFPALLVLTLVFFRFRPLFLFLMAAPLASHLSRNLLASRMRWWLPALLSIGLMIHTARAEKNAYFYRFGAGVHSGIFPVQGAEFLRRAQPKGRMFNTYGLGGYLMWALGPEYPVFIDGREDVYLGPGVLDEYLRAFDSPERWQDLVGKYAIEFAVVRYPEQPPASPDRSLDVLAFPRESWALVYFDDTAAIYVRRSQMNRGLIEQNEIRLVQPLQLSGYLDGIVRDPARLGLFLQEMESNLRANPRSFRAHFTLGVLAVKRGGDYLGEAIRQFELAADRNPDFAPAHLNLGSLYFGTGRMADAERAFRRALAVEPSPLAEEMLKRIRSSR